jgi:hypothetical protein
MHRSYRCRGCAHTVYDPVLEDGCREAVRMGTLDGGLTD